MAVVMKCPATNEVSVDDAGFIDKRATADFQIEATLWHRSHATSFDTVGIRRYFNPMADAGHRLVRSEEVFRYAD